jgi:hypothetical protein
VTVNFIDRRERAGRTEPKPPKERLEAELITRHSPSHQLQRPLARPVT